MSEDFEVGELGGAPERRALLDLAHLRRQTFDDPALEREVLTLLLGQIRGSAYSLFERDTSDPDAVLHRLKGAALGVGALALAEAAARAEGRRCKPESDLQAVLVATAAAVEARLAGQVSRL